LNKTLLARVGHQLASFQNSLHYRVISILFGQDWMTLMAWEHPEMFHILPCAYNYQVLQTYQESTCPDKDWKIIHGLLPGNNV
jgi:hypothetical protein